MSSSMAKLYQSARTSFVACLTSFRSWSLSETDVAPIKLQQSYMQSDNLKVIPLVQLTSNFETIIHTNKRFAIFDYLTSIVALTMAPCHLFHEKFIFTTIERSLLDPLEGQSWLISKR